MADTTSHRSSNASTLPTSHDEEKVGEQQQQPGKDANIVDWDGEDDPANPHNWPMWRKWLYCSLLGSTTFVVTFASSVFSTAIEPTSQEYGVSTEVMVLGVALFVLGFAWGPLVFGPISELYGRKIPLFAGYFAFAVFQIPVAVAQNLQTIFICRFFGGFFSSAPLAIIGGQLADFFDPVRLNLAICVFSAATFIGPVTGPIVGGFITQSHLGWRWTAWITLIMAALFGGIACLIVPESFAPILLHQKAKRLRYETRNWALHSKSDEQQINVRQIVEKYLYRPIHMTVMEPILIFITLYLSFIYGLIYLTFELYPGTFQMARGLNLGVGALPFLSIGVGVLCGAATISVFTLTVVKKKFEETGKVIPEDRLIPMILGGILLPIGLFWFGWTSSPKINLWPQIIAGIPIGWGIQMIFMQGLVYIIDVYKMHANSAIAANTFVRSWFGAGFPMFAMAMYRNLGIDWAASVLGFIAVGLAPVPVIFYVYGHKIRSWSKYSPT